MKNAIPMSTHYQWWECNSFRELAYLLVHKVNLEGKRIEAHGRFRLASELVYPRDVPCEDKWVDITWLRIKNGLLLVRWPFDLYKGGYQRDEPSVLWIPDIQRNTSPLVEACLQIIDTAKIGRITESYDVLSVKQEVGLTVGSIVLLQDDYSLYAFPLEKIPREHFLHDLKSKKLHALGIEFVEKGYAGYLDLHYCDLFVQGPFWRFSWFPRLKREPVLATNSYAYMVLVAGKERTILECDGSEKRECLFCELYAGKMIDVVHRFVFRVACTGDWPNDPYFNPREIWEEAMVDWRVFLAHDDWESLFETLCKPDYENHTVDPSWLSLINESNSVDYWMMKQALHYLYDWVERVLENEEGITAYCIW